MDINTSKPSTKNKHNPWKIILLIVGPLMVVLILGAVWTTSSVKTTIPLTTAEIRILEKKAKSLKNVYWQDRLSVAYRFTKGPGFDDELKPVQEYQVEWISLFGIRTNWYGIGCWIYRPEIDVHNVPVGDGTSFSRTGYGTGKVFCGNPLTF